MNNSELRDKLLFFKHKIEDIRRLKAEIVDFEEDPDNDITPGSYKIGNDLFVVTYKNKRLVIAIQSQPVDLG